ncbi:MAG: amylo-alpha-1,6-glucosidase, partial [Desulfatirhabdiaceae bacterium]
MTVSKTLIQYPVPGSHMRAFQGDRQTFSLRLNRLGSGSAWIRTNIGHAAATRREIHHRIDQGSPPLARDWFDIPMVRVSGQEFQIVLGLTETGHFEAKCFYLDENQSDPEWPEGPNTSINVSPWDICCANTIYNAFVRQFGPNKSGQAVPDIQESACVRQLDEKGYTVIPRSGSFRDLISELDFIMGVLGCRILHLLPIHPTPTTYARMGRFGSPYAALSFTAVDPALAVFDPRATPLEQFVEMVDAVHARCGKIIIDIAPNHTGWAASLHETHPEWLARDESGKIEVPGAWGVLWEDLTRLDYSHHDLWKYMADVFLTWCRRGVDGFRCDAGYMIPVEAWQYITAVVRDQYPDTILFLEGLGGKISVARDILNLANFNWAYSELFQNDDRSQIEGYLPGAIEISQADGLLVHFAETHDNNRLAARSHNWARMRTALCALFSDLGGFGFANGLEWLASDKIMVHESSSLNWGHSENQVQHIQRLNAILKTHPCFHSNTRLKLIHVGPGNSVVLHRLHVPSGKALVIVANLNDSSTEIAAWNPCFTDVRPLDLITGQPVRIERTPDIENMLLQPGQVVCLTSDSSDMNPIEVGRTNGFHLPESIRYQGFCAMALEIRHGFTGIQDLSGFDIHQAVQELSTDPIAFLCRMNPDSDEPRLIVWKWPQDQYRTVPIPQGFFLMLRAPFPFRSTIMAQDRTLMQKNSLPVGDETHVVVFQPAAVHSPVTRTLRLSVFETGKSHHSESLLLFLTDPDPRHNITRLNRSECITGSPLFLSTNRCGAMLRARVSWGMLDSRYDALLAANLDPNFPEDRWILLARCRAWIVYQGYSQEICMNCLDAFSQDKSGWGIWRFHVPCGQGQHILLTIGMMMQPEENTVLMDFYRSPTDSLKSTLPDHQPVRLILRPDIEDRSFHEVTKAYLGPEHRFPDCISATDNGFRFSPASDRDLTVTLPNSEFFVESEWQYMVYRSLEAERGLDPYSDLFSPGYFSVDITGSQSVRLIAAVNADPQKMQPSEKRFPSLITESSILEQPSEEIWRVMKQSLMLFVVRRNDLMSVIAGFPWFLDWGRDSLIAVRGIIAAGELDVARSIILQYARFEENGTLPNMNQGKTPANRDTSDAPLWLFVAVSDLIQAEGSDSFLEADCGGRTVRDVLIAIGNAWCRGTPNGIHLDFSSGLIFSPPHFTWMDTNYPAGTPRQGYPVEIQALWYHAAGLLSVIDRISHRDQWKDRVRTIETSIQKYFWRPQDGYLSDCLHAEPGCPASKALPDDALRPNQLLAITLSAVRNPIKKRSILMACQKLIVPGAIRSLADHPVSTPIEIRHNGHLLGDPSHPYIGIYMGDEDTQRKPAYHNGTAWTWQFPLFCEAWFKTYGRQGAKTAFSYLTSGMTILKNGCIGHIP